MRGCCRWARWRSRRAWHWRGGVGASCRDWRGGALCGLFLLLPFFLRMAGAGDVKLLFVCGCWLGNAGVATFLMLTSLGGFALAVTFLLCRRDSAARLRHLLRTLVDVRYDRAAGRARLPARTDEAGRIPFSLAIALGYLGTVALLGGQL